MLIQHVNQKFFFIIAMAAIAIATNITIVDPISHMDSINPKNISTMGTPIVRKENNK